MFETSVPLTRADRLWTGSTVLTAIGPLVVPTREAMIEAFTTLALAGADARVGLRFDRGSPRRWSYRTDDLARHAPACVVQLPPGADDDVDALLARLTAAPGTDRPLSVYLGDRYVFVQISHALGDGRLALALPPALVALTQGRPLPRWAVTPADHQPLRSALRHTFHDRAAVTALLARRQHDRGARVRPDCPGRTAALFRPAPASVTELGEPGQTREVLTAVRALRADRSARGPGHFAVVAVAVAQALAEQGIDCAPSLHMLYDLRRYLPRGHSTMASFVAGLDLPVRLDDPLAITDAVAQAAKAGHPLAVAARASLRSPRRPTTASVLTGPPRAQLALSYLGQRTPDPELPWTAGPDERRYWSRVDPAGPSAITLLVATIGRRLQVSASFHESVFDPTAVRRALRAVHDDPIGLLHRAAGARAGTRVRA